MNKYFDAEKALEAVLYVAAHTSDLFHIVKILYFADKFSLEKNGIQITGDYYVAMRDGPVPSGAYDLIKYARGDEFKYEEKIVEAHSEKALEVKEKIISPLRDFNPDFLSENDIECLNEAIDKYADMDLDTLWKIVHEEESYKKTLRNQAISLRELITLDIPNGKDVIEFLEA